jgi:hypothetical protein
VRRLGRGSRRCLLSENDQEDRMGGVNRARGNMVIFTKKTDMDDSFNEVVLNGKSQ